MWKFIMTFLIFVTRYKWIFHYLDSITKELTQGGTGFIFVVKDPDFDLEVVLKLIRLGAKGHTSEINNLKIIEKEIKVGMIVAVLIQMQC
jgi:hypothetical protein